MTYLPNNTQNQPLSIHEASEFLGVSTKTLRRWEAKKVLVPVRTAGGHRRYSFKKLVEFKNKGAKSKSNTTYDSSTIFPPSFDALPTVSYFTKPLPETQTSIEPVLLPHLKPLEPSEVPGATDLLKNAISATILTSLVALVLAGFSILFTAVKINLPSIGDAQPRGDRSELFGANPNQENTVIPHEDAGSRIENDVLAASSILQDVNLNINVPTNIDNSFRVSGASTFDDDIALNGTNVTSTQDEVNLFIGTSPGTINIGGGASTTSIGGIANLGGNSLISPGDLLIDPGGGGVSIGTGTASTINLAGDDFFVSGDFEVDGSLVVGSDSITDLTGSGLQVSSGALQATLGTSITTGEIENDTILEVDLDITNDPTDNYILTYDSATAGFTWVASSAAVITIENNDTGVGTDVTTIDFSTDFTVAASPASETNVSIADDILSFTEFSDTLTAEDGTILDLSSINHSTTAIEGIKLPQSALSSGPSSGDGFLAFDTDDNQVKVWYSGAWSSIAGASTTLQQSYANDADGSDAIIALTADDDSIIVRNPSSSGTDSGYLMSLDQLNTGSVDALQVSNSGTGDSVQITNSSTGLIMNLAASGSGTTADGILISQTGSGTITDAIDLSDETITNALNIGANIIIGTTASIDFTNFDVATTGAITTGAAGQDGQLVIYNDLATDRSITINPSSSQGADITYTLPPDDGAADNYVLTTDGSGVLNWEAVTGAGAVDETGTNTSGQIAYFTDDNTLTSSSNWVFVDSQTTGNTLSVAATTLTTGNLLDGTATYVDATGGTDSAIDINLTNNPVTNANTLRGLDIGFTDAGSLANTIYGVYIDATTANSSDTTYAGVLLGGNVGINDATPDARLEILATTEQLRLTYTDGTVDARFTVDSSGNLNIDVTGTKTIITDDLQVTGNDILSSSATAALTLSGTDVTVAGDLTVSGGDIIGIATTNLLNTASTTINFASAATTLNMADAAITGTIDIGGVTSDGTSTINIATNGAANADVITIGNSNAGTTLALTGGDDWNISTTGILTLSASAAQTSAIVATDTDYTNFADIGDNDITGTTFDIIGTTGTINLTYFDVSATGAITTGGATQDGQFIIYNDLATDRTITINPSSSQSLDITYTLPPDDGGADNYVLTTDSTGVLNWEAITGAGGVGGSGTQNALAKFTVTGNTIGDSSITDDGTTVTLSTDVSLSLGAGEEVSLSNTGANSDQLSLSVSGVTTTGIDALSLSFTQADDIDATDDNAAARIALTSSSTQADLLYGIDLANITAGAATETALRIGSGFDNLFELEGSTNDGIELFVQLTDPTSTDKTITFPNDTGTVCLSSGNCAGGSGGSKWTDSGVITYFTAYTTDDVAIGDTTSASEFYFDILSTDSGQLSMNPSSVGTKIDINLETEWTSGTLINADFGSSTTQGADLDITGLVLNLNTNLTANADADVTGINVQTPVLTSTEAVTTNYSVYNNSASGALTQNTAAGTINWRGLNLTMPNITATTGTITSDGVRVANGTITTGGTQSLFHAITTGVGAGTLYGLNIDGITASGGTEQAIAIGAGWDTDINATTSLEIGIGGANELTLTATALAPSTDSGQDLGTSSLQFADLYLDGGNVNIDNATDIDIDDNVSGALSISQGTNDYINITTTDTTTTFLIDMPVAGSSSTTANLFTSNLTKTINIGTGTDGDTINLGDGTGTNAIDIGGVGNSGTDTINISTEATASDVITIGNSHASTTLALTGGDDWSISTAGLGIFSQVGIGTTAPDAALEINHATGDSLRLTYNDANGSAADYTDFSLSSTGALTLTGSAATLAASATAEKTFLTLTPGTITLTAPTAVTSLMETSVITGATIAANAATTVDKATTLSLVAPIDSTNATLTADSALRILNVTSGAGTLTTQYGLFVEDLTAGASDYGIYIAGADTYSLYTAAGSVSHLFEAAEGLVLDSEATDSTGTAGVIDLDLDATSSQQAINLDIETIADAGVDTLIGLDILATQTSTDDDVVYGMRVQNLGGTPDAGNEYGIYQAGISWDYGLYVEDAALFNTTAVINGTYLGLDYDADAGNVISVGTGPEQSTGSLFWGNDLLCDPALTNCGWATSASSPFTQSGADPNEIIDKSDLTARLRLQYGDAGDIQLEIDSTSNTIVPTADAVSIDLSSGATNTGIITADVDGLYLVMEAGNIVADGAISGVHINFDPITGGGAGDLFYGLNIDGITATGATEAAINIGSGWDTGIAISSAIAGEALDLTSVAGIRTTALIDLNENNTTGTVPTIQWDSAADTTRGGFMDINLAGALATENLIDLTTSAAWTSNLLDINLGAGISTGNVMDITFGTAAHTGNAIDLNMGTNVAGQAIDINLTGARTDDGINIDDDSTGNTPILDMNISGVRTGNAIDITYATAAATENAIDLNMGTNVAGDAINISAAATTGDSIDITPGAARTSGAALKITDGSLAAAVTDALIQLDITGTSDTNSLDFDISGGSAVSGNQLDITYSSAAHTGNAIDLNMGTNVAGNALAIATAGTTTGRAIEIISDGTIVDSLIDVDMNSGDWQGNILEVTTGGSASDGDVFNITLEALDVAVQNMVVTNAAATTAAGWLMDVDTSAAWTGIAMDIDIAGAVISTGNFLDVTYSSGAHTGNAFDLNMGTNVAGNAIDIATAATTGNAIDITTTGVFTNELIDINVGANAATGDVINIDMGSTATGAQAFVLTNTSASTVNQVDLTANSLVSGNLIDLNSTSTGLTTGSFISSSFTGNSTFTGDLNYFEWAPTTSTTASGDIFQINIGTSGTTTGKLFRVSDTGSDLFAISETTITSALPHEFTAAGDLSVAYDIAFTNQTASYIKSNGPVTIEAGESFESNNLTLKTYNSGDIVFDVPATGTAIVQGAFSVDSQQTLTANSTTPSVAAGSHFITANTSDPTLISNFTSGTTGQMIFVEAGDAVTDFDCTASSLNCGNADITAVTAGDTFNFIYDGTNWNMISWIDNGTSYATGGADLAELFVSYIPLVPGEIVKVDPDNDKQIVPTNSSYDHSAVGVVSTAPGITLGTETEGKTNYAIALAGRVPARIAENSEPIRKGDFIATSNEVGRAMKATSQGNVIGTAMEDWTPGSGQDKIVMFINNSYANPNPAPADSGSVIPDPDPGSETLVSDVESLESRVTLLEDQLDIFLSTTLNTPVATDSGTATSSGNIVIPHEDAGSGSFEKLTTTDLSVSGDAVLGDVTITGNLNIGTLSVDGFGNSIDAIGTLAIQPLALGNIEFLGGLITFDTDGNIVAKTIEVEKISIKGDSAGIGAIPEGENEAYIATDQVTTDSLILVTPTSGTRYPLVVATKEPGLGFTVQIPVAPLSDINFDWLIVDKR